MNPINTNGVPGAQRIETERASLGTKSADSNNTGATQAASSKQVLADDTVELTDTASRLGQLSAQVKAADGVDFERVEALRQKIADGNYDIDPGRIADELIRQEQELA